MNPKRHTPHEEKVEKMRTEYDTTAAFYDARYRHIQFLKYGILFQKLVSSKIRMNTYQKGPILDAGGGSGLYLEFLKLFSDYLNDIHVCDERIQQILEFTEFLLGDTIKSLDRSIFDKPIILCDISFEMLHIALEKKCASLLYGIVACDCSHLPFRDESFSISTAFTVFQNIEKVENAIKEVFRVLGDTSTLGISILKKKSNKLKFTELLGRYFLEISPIHVEEALVEFQKLMVQSDKYSHFYDLAQVEDYFLIAKKTPRHPK